MSQAVVKTLESIEHLPSAVASYASDWRKSKGRTEMEPSSDDRTPYQRDRDRIIYSDAFRKLQYKTQVFMNSEEGDFRTRLTHTLEVAQLTRGICRFLELDEDLGEVIALAHDLGHPPFGHAGEDAINECMSKFTGFDHNEHTMRTLRVLESPYPAFDGLNLTWETLEGVAKHNGPVTGELAKNELFADLEPEKMPSLEAQVAAVCDELAYKHHDLDDGLAAGKIHLEEVMTLPQFKRVWDEVTATYPMINKNRQIKETIRRMISRQVKDILTFGRVQIKKSKVQTVENVRDFGEMIIVFSPKVVQENIEMKAFLMEKLYRHTSVNRFNFQAHRMINDLSSAFMNHRKMLPPEWRSKLPEDSNDEAGKALVVKDYLASLTDRSATREHMRLFAPLNNI